MRILIADDEQPARLRLRRLLAGLPGTAVVGEAAGGEAVLDAARAMRPDLVLLDIHMPGMSGLEVARALARLPSAPAVIFTTAFEEHALEAFDLAAADYLLKPVRPERLSKALERVAERRAGQAPSGNTVRVYHRGGMRLMPLEEVVLFRADHKYVTAVHQGGEALLETSLKALEEQFGESLVRIHRNTLISRERLVGIDKLDGIYCAVLEGSDFRPEISRRHASQVKRLLGEAASI